MRSIGIFPIEDYICTRPLLNTLDFLNVKRIQFDPEEMAFESNVVWPSLEPYDYLRGHKMDILEKMSPDEFPILAVLALAKSAEEINSAEIVKPEMFETLHPIIALPTNYYSRISQCVRLAFTFPKVIFPERILKSNLTQEVYSNSNSFRRPLVPGMPSPQDVFITLMTYVTNYYGKMSIPWEKGIIRVPLKSSYDQNERIAQGDTDIFITSVDIDPEVYSSMRSPSSRLFIPGRTLQIVYQ